MNAGEFWTLAGLTDDVLELRLRALLAACSRTEAHVIAHLAEVEARRLHLLQGFQSLFEYCKKALGLSGNEAFYRIVAARMAQQFPAIFELLERRELFITTLPLLRDYITRENHSELLDQVRGKSKAEVLELLATRVPRPDARSHIRKLPTTSRSVAAGPTGTLEPLSAVSYRLQLNTSHALKEKLELARDLMSHSNPSGDLAVVVERALELLIAQLQARRFGITHGRAPNHSHHPPPEAPTPPNDRQTDTAPASAPAAPAPAASASAASASAASASAASAPAASAPAAPAPAAPAPAAPASAPAASAPAASAASAAPAPAAPAAPAPDFDRSKSKHPPPPARAARPHIPHQVRREVAQRDGLQCSFTAPDGRRCQARAFLQLDHQRAWAHGGPHTSENLRLLCAHHNALHAERCFGAPLSAQRTKRAG